MARSGLPAEFTFAVKGRVAPSSTGIAWGETDDFGYMIAKDEVHVHDFHATILHLLGFDHTRLTYHYMGRDFRLTDVSGNVVKKLLA